MPTPFDNAALVGVGSCGCHQTVMGAAIVASGDFTSASSDFTGGTFEFNGAPAQIGDIFDFSPLPPPIDDGSYGVQTDPETDIDAGGVIASDVGRVVLVQDALLEQFKDAGGVTVVFDVRWTEPAGSFVSAEVRIIGDSQSYAVITVDSLEARGNGVVDNWATDPALLVGDVVHRIAVTFSDSFVKVCMNGGTVRTVNNPAIDASKTLMFFDMGFDLSLRLRKFDFLLPVTDDEDLQALSVI